MLAATRAAVASAARPAMVQRMVSAVSGASSAGRRAYSDKSDKINLSAGPAAMDKTARGLWFRDLHEGPQGVPLAEGSHRSGPITQRHEEIHDQVRQFFGVPEDRVVLLLPISATQAFFQIPAHMVGSTDAVTHVVNGTWSKKWSKHTSNLPQWFSRAVAPRMCDLGPSDPDADNHFIFYNANETISGQQTLTSAVPHREGNTEIGDFTSGLGAIPIDWGELSFGGLFAGLQKGWGLPVTTLAILPGYLVDRPPGLAAINGTILDLRQFLGAGMPNTPNVVANAAFGRSLESYQVTFGTYNVMAQHMQQRVRGVYEVIDGSDGFYQAKEPDVPDQHSRSATNVVFKLRTPELTDRFLAAATEKELIGIKNHRSEPDFKIRASFYAGVPDDAVDAFALFLQRFMVENR